MSSEQQSSSLSSTEVKSEASDSKSKEDTTCVYCKKKGHIVSTCPVLKKKNTKFVALVKTVSDSQSL